MTTICHQELKRSHCSRSFNFATKSMMMLHQTFDPICYQDRDEANRRVSLYGFEVEKVNRINMDGKKETRCGLVIRKGKVLGLKYMFFFNKTCRFALQGSYQLEYKSTISGIISENKLTKLTGVKVKVMFSGLILWRLLRMETILDSQLGLRQRTLRSLFTTRQILRLRFRELDSSFCSLFLLLQTQATP